MEPPTAGNPRRAQRLDQARSRHTKVGVVQVSRILARFAGLAESSLGSALCRWALSRSNSRKTQRRARCFNRVMATSQACGVARERWNEEVNAFLTPAWTTPLTIAKLDHHNLGE